MVNDVGGGPMRGRMVSAIAVFVCALFWGGCCLGDAGRGIGVVPIRDDNGEQVGLYEESHALLIGVSDYTAGWPDLDSVPDELKQVKATLESNGFEVEMLLNPDGLALKRGFDDFIDRYGYDHENRLLFFFSGHGYSNQNRTKGFLVPTDAPDPRVDEKNFLRKALDMTQILAWSRAMTAKHALFLFDSCFSGAIFQTKALPNYPPHITRYTNRPVRQFISAGSAGEQVPAKSVFTPSFIKALRGDADLSRDGYVTGTELGLYLREKVLYYNAGQTPQYGKIRDPELDDGDFVFMVPRPVAGGDSTPGSQSAPTGTLKVESSPDQAALYVNGVLRGQTPLTLAGLQPGRLMIRAEKDGREEEETVEVTAGRTSRIKLALAPRTAKGRLYVDSRPRGASISILNTRETYRDGMELDAGRYDILVSLDGYENKTENIELDANEDLRVHVNLKLKRREERGPTMDSLQALVNKYMTANNNNDIRGLIDLYASRVDYFNAGTVTRDFIFKDKANYYKRWPEIQFELVSLGEPKDLDGNRKQVTFTIRFDVYSRARQNGVRGMAENQLIVEQQDDRLKIVSDKQKVIHSTKYR